MFLLKEGHQFSTVSSSVSHFCPPSQPFWQARFKMIEHQPAISKNSNLGFEKIDMLVIVIVIVNLFGKAV